MATVTATIGLSSRDISDNGLNISRSSTLTEAGVNTGVGSTTGLSSKTYASTAAVELIDYSEDDISGNAAKIYIKNTSSSSTQYVEIAIGTTGSHVEIARLYGGDWMFIPYTGGSGADIIATPSTTDSVTLEYLGIY
tara:strand:- start:10 stop:420 length:411 start_codon:yes stop_codon:yes gene_type:complete